MLAPLLDRMLNFNLGLPGRFIVNLLQNHMLIFLGVFFLYGSVLLYAKFIWSEYLPKQMKQFVAAQTDPAVSQEELFQHWVDFRKTLPRYLVVPTRNEWWVKPAAAMTGQEKMLFYNSKKKKMTEQERFVLVLEETTH